MAVMQWSKLRNRQLSEQKNSKNNTIKSENLKSESKNSRFHKTINKKDSKNLSFISKSRNKSSSK